ncbi:MAG: hypothetical protein JWP69_498 [Flaviaesturariibacter sp.]|nr:hypothetical protein [Flaviaesturariibacter sp.]
MTLSNKAYDNPFSSVHITPARLYRFGNDVGGRLLAKTGEPYTALTAGLKPALTALGDEIGETDMSVLAEKSTLIGADAFLADFRQTMKGARLPIEYAFGGRASAGYQSFFPKGLQEYTKATKGTVELLTNRLGELADLYSTKLDAALAGRFREFKSAWKTAEASISTTGQAAAENRGQRSEARRRVEVELFRILCRIGAEFPDNPQACMQFFDFSLLKAARHSSRERKAKDVAPVTG